MPRRKTKSEVIESFKKVHGDRYDYSKVEYVNQTSDVTIICRVHGEFNQRPQHHSNGSGCKKCGNNTMTHDQFIDKFKEVHGDRYDYSLSKPKTTKHAIDIVCSRHGIFSQNVGGHMRGNGCKKCSNEEFGRNQIKDYGSHIKDFEKIHGGMYDYSNTKIVLSRDKCSVRCRSHGDFMITPKNHLAGHGCPKCSNTSFNPKLPSILYVLKIRMLDGRVSYKIGITNRNVPKRYYSKDMKFIESYEEYFFWDGGQAREIELHIKRRFSDNICDKINYPLSSGFTECFYLDFDLNKYIKLLENY